MTAALQKLAESAAHEAHGCEEYDATCLTCEQQAAAILAALNAAVLAERESHAELMRQAVEALERAIGLLTSRWPSKAMFSASAETVLDEARKAAAALRSALAEPGREGE